MRAKKGHCKCNSNFNHREKEGNSENNLFIYLFSNLKLQYENSLTEYS